MEQRDIEILLVEDNPYEADLAIRSLRKGHIANKVIHLEDGAEALDFLFSRGKYEGAIRPKPRLVLLDLNLPKVSGIEVLKQLKNNPETMTIPVVVLTASAEEKDIIESYRLGVNSYIVKPVNFGSFAEAVAELKLYWLVLNQPPL